MSPETTWRLYYQMPPTDPRFLNTDKITMIQDLLMIRYRKHAQWTANNPEEAAIEDGSAGKSVEALRSNTKLLNSYRRGIRAHLNKNSANVEYEKRKIVALSLSKEPIK